MPVRDLDLSLFRAFVAVAEEGGMTAAGEKLHLTQAAVSQQIRRLEMALQKKLFLRGHRQIRLTSSGKALLPKARAILKTSDEIWAEMTSPPMLGEVRLGAPTDIVNSYLPYALRAFAKEFPQVDVTLVCRTSPKLVEEWQSGAIDVAVVEEPIGFADQQTHKECLLVDRLVWVGARNGEAIERSPLPVSLSNDSNALRPAMMRALQREKIDFRTVSEVGTIETISATVRTDLAVTALLQSTVPADVEVLSGRDNLPDLPHFEINLLGAREQENSVVAALCHKIRQAFLTAMSTENDGSKPQPLASSYPSLG